MASDSSSIGSLWDSGVRLRCPACGKGPIFEAWVQVRAACPTCGQPFSMGEGDFVGGVYVNYGIVAILCFAVFFWMEAQGGYSTAQEVWTMMAVAVLVPIVSMRHARAFFMATMYRSGGLPTRRETGEAQR